MGSFFKVFKIFLFFFGVLSAFVSHADQAISTHWHFGDPIEGTNLGVGYFQNNLGKSGLEFNGNIDFIYNSYSREIKALNANQGGVYVDVGLKYSLQFDHNKDRVSSYRFQGPEAGYSIHIEDAPKRWTQKEVSLIPSQELKAEIEKLENDIKNKNYKDLDPFYNNVKLSSRGSPEQQAEYINFWTEQRKKEIVEEIMKEFKTQIFQDPNYIENDNEKMEVCLIDKKTCVTPKDALSSEASAQIYIEMLKHLKDSNANNSGLKIKVKAMLPDKQNIFSVKDIKIARFNAFAEKDLKNNTRIGFFVDAFRYSGKDNFNHILNSQLYAQLSVIGSIVGMGVGFNKADDIKRGLLTVNLPSITGEALLGLPEIGEIKANASIAAKIIDVGDKGRLDPQNTFEGSLGVSLQNLFKTHTGIYYRLDGTGNIGSSGIVIQHNTGAQAAF